MLIAIVKMFIFTGWVDKMNTAQLNMLNRSQYGRGTDSTQNIFEHTGNNCYLSTSVNCFKKVFWVFNPISL